MEALRQDDPRRLGPYAPLFRLRETASAVQYLAHGSDGTTAVVAVARPELAGLPAFRRRFQAEAQTAERLAGGWVQAPLASRDDAPGSGGEPGLWTATAYVPALTLAEAVALAGPLPERTVRILGAALAETLSRVHATGAVLHGLAADTVLLAADGPRLTAFGALGAAAAAEAGPGGQLSVRLGYLTPEQLTGREPGPASDIFVLGLLLAYAATGATPWAGGPQDTAADRIAHDEPELAAVPQRLRDLVARCLAKSPADRPSPGVLAAELALEGAAALARPGWLPEPLVSALTDQAARAAGPGADARDGLVAAEPGADARDGAGAAAHGPAALPAPSRRRDVGPAAPDAGFGSGPGPSTRTGSDSGSGTGTSTGSGTTHGSPLSQGPAAGDARGAAAGLTAAAPRPALVATPANGHHLPAGGAVPAGPATEGTPEGPQRDRALDLGAAVPAATGQRRAGEDSAGTTGAADVEGGLTRRLVTRRRTGEPADNLSDVTRRLVAPSGADLRRGELAATPPPPQTPSAAGTGPLTPAPPLAHPAAALTLPPATAAPVRPAPQPPTSPTSAPVPAPTPAGPGHRAGPSHRAGPAHRAGDRLGAALSRRGLLTGIAAGAAGLLVGGGGVLALSGGEDEAPAPRAKAPEPAARRKPLPGVGPDPLWHYQHPVALVAGGPVARLWRERVLLIPGEELTTALDVRTGRRLWEQKAAGTAYGPEAADDAHCLVVTATDFVWLSVQDGRVKHREPLAPLLTKGQKDARATLGGRVAAEGSVVWFSARVETLGGKKKKVTRTRTYLLAYDMAARRELWRTEMPNGRPGPVPRYEAVGMRPGSLLVRQDDASLTADQRKKAKDRSAFVLVDRRTGKTLWRKSFPGVRPDAGATDDPAGRLYAAVDGGLQAYDTRNGKKLWTVKEAAGPVDDAPSGFGRGVMGGTTLYVPSGDNEVYAVDTVSGDRQWRRATEYPGRATPRLSLSGSGRTVLALNDTQATAVAARDGRRLWKFQDSGPAAPGAEDAWTSYRAQAFGDRAVLWRGRNFYALPLD
ncbi:outer membrane protein assembly factor BamB family protein [Streptomyces sp. NPDC054887]